MGLFGGGGGFNPLPTLAGGAIGHGLGSALLGPVGGGMGLLTGAAAGSRGGQPGYQAPGLDGLPMPGQFRSITDEGGYLKDPYKVSVDKLGDASGWAKIAGEKNAAQTQNLLDAANKQNLSSMQGGLSELEMAGGLSSGARERLAGVGAKQGLMAAQDVRNQGNLNALDIGLQTENLNRDATKFNIGNQLQTGQINTGRAAGDMMGQNDYNKFLYGEQMKDFSGRYGADAMGRSYGQGPKSGWEGLVNTLSFNMF